MLSFLCCEGLVKKEVYADLEKEEAGGRSLFIVPT